MKKYLLITCILTMIACSEGNNSTENATPQDSDISSSVDWERYDKICADIDNYLDTHNQVSYEDIINYLVQTKAEVTSVVEDSVLYLKTPDNMEMEIDLYGQFTSKETTEVVAIDDMEKEEAQLDEGLGMDDEEGSTDESMSTSNCFPELATNDSLSSVDFIEPDDVAASQLAQSSLISENTQNGMRATTGSKEVALSRMKILYYDPWVTDLNGKTAQEIKKIVNKIQKKVPLRSYALVGNKCTLSSLKILGNYDVVFFATHGDRKGRILIPTTCPGYKEIAKSHGLGNSWARNNKGKKLRAYVLGPNFTTWILPNLRRTVFWTCMCYGAAWGGSVLQEAAITNGAPIYTGADRTVTDYVALNNFSRFLVKFYTGKLRASLAFSPYDKVIVSMCGYRVGVERLTLEDASENPYGLSGNYRLIVNHDAYFYDNRPHRKQTLQVATPSKTVVRSKFKTDKTSVTMQYNRGQRSSSRVMFGSNRRADGIDGDIEMGVVFKNLQTGQIKYVSYQSSNTVVEREFEGSLVSVLNLDLSVQGLEVGKYVYTAYIKNEGDITLSTESYPLEVIDVGDCDYIEITYSPVLADESKEVSVGHPQALSGRDFKFVGFYSETGMSIYDRTDRPDYHPFKYEAYCPQGGTVRLLFKGTLEEIGDDAFSSSRVSSFRIPSTVKRLGNSALSMRSDSTILNFQLPEALEEVGPSGCSAPFYFKNLVLPPNLRKIDSNAFYDVIAETVTLPASLKIAPIDYKNDDWIPRKCKKLVICCDYLEGLEKSFKSAKYKLESVEIQAQWKKLPDGFLGQYFMITTDPSHLTDVILPDCMEEIGREAFAGCEKLASITLPSNLRIIGDNAFWDCAAMKSIVIPEKVEQLCYNCLPPAEEIYLMRPYCYDKLESAFSYFPFPIIYVPSIVFEEYKTKYPSLKKYFRPM